MTIDEILALIGSQAGMTQPMPGFPKWQMRHSVGPPSPPAELEAASDSFALPVDLAHLWAEAGTLRLFEEIRYGQWGLVLLSPLEAIRETMSMGEQRSEDMLPGDLVVGAFKAEEQRVVVRCDAQADDFGRVLIALPIDFRQDWPLVGEDLADFLTQFISAGGDQYWPH